MRKWILPACIALAVAVAFGSYTVAGDKDKQGPNRGTQIGEHAPKFSLQNHDGKTVNLADHSGKIVVLEWFNEDCPYVVRHYEAGTMSDLAKKYADKNVVWLAINTTAGKSNQTNKTIAEKWNMAFPLLNDSNGQVGQAYGAKTTPHMFIINAEGVVVYDGAIDNDPRGNKSEDRVNYVDKALSEITSGQSVSEPQTKPYGCTIKYAR